MLVAATLAFLAIGGQATSRATDTLVPPRGCPPDVPSATVTYRMPASADQPPVAHSVTACGEAVRVKRGDVPAMPVAPPKVPQ